MYFKNGSIFLGADQDNVIILDNYNYTSFLETHLTFNEDYKKTALSCGNYYADTPGKMDTMLPTFAKGIDVIVRS